MNYSEAMNFLQQPRWQCSKPGLERTYELLDKLGNPQNDLKYIHVTGTNGKGSNCAMMESVLRRAGYVTGLYTSPYIFCFNERIRVNGDNIPNEDVAALIDEIRPVAEAMADSPTEFEIVTALAFLYFARMHCDIVVLEVGMGGELDSTNVIPSPVLAVFTSISLDHVQFLGPTIEDIARTKAGIIKPGCEVILYQQQKQVKDVISKKAAACGARLTECDEHTIRNAISMGAEGQRFDWKDYQDLEIPFIPNYQVKNALTALTAISVLQDLGYSISEKAIREGLAFVNWPGRFQVVSKEPTVIVDGSHNEEGMRASISAVRKSFAGRKVYIVMGVLADKDVESMGAEALSVAVSIYTVTPPNPRAMSSADLRKALEAIVHEKPLYNAVEIVDGICIRDAIATVFNQAKEKDVILCIGSLYMLKDLVDAINICNQKD